MDEIAWLIFVRIEPVGAVSITDGAFSCLPRLITTPMQSGRWRFASPGKMNHLPGRGKFGAGSGYRFFQRRRAFPIIGLNTGMMEGLHQDRAEQGGDSHPTTDCRRDNLRTPGKKPLCAKPDQTEPVPVSDFLSALLLLCIVPLLAHVRHHYRLQGLQHRQGHY
jgi:hypothetical protein